MKNATWLVVTILVLTTRVISAGETAGETGAAERKAIIAVDEQYAVAFNKGDSAAAAALFTDDAIYETPDGATLRGRREIEATLRDQFAETGGAKLKIRIHALELDAEGKGATERGSAILTFPDGITEASSYIAEFTKSQGQWRVSRLKEKPEAAAAEKLRPLAWMIGDWEDSSPELSIRTRSEWSMDKAFITRKFDIYIEGKRDITGIEYIGWDPETQQIRSWYFDSAGGFGQASWRPEGARWIQEASGTLSNGDAASATHILTPKDNRSFTWQSVNRRIGEEAQPDIPEVTIMRKDGTTETALKE